MARSMGKKKRFDVFRRDQFICQYCGRRPPAVVLEVDHIKPVSEGGSNDDHNLITSCFDCNRGKAAGTLEATPINVAEKAALLQERMEQARAYDELLAAEREDLDWKAVQIIDVFETEFEGWTLKDSSRASIIHFLRNLPFVEVRDAMQLACSRMIKDRAFRYFCGVCWNKIRGTTPS